jgi:hypothetical protein
MKPADIPHNRTGSIHLFAAKPDHEQLPDLFLKKRCMIHRKRISGQQKHQHSAENAPTCHPFQKKHRFPLICSALAICLNITCFPAHKKRMKKFHVPANAVILCGYENRIL